jgi:hypothetical protein
VNIRRIALCTSILFVCIPLLTFCEVVTRDQVASQNAAWDFGQVKEGKILHHNFGFKNRTKGILHITTVSTSCGCTVSHVTKKILKPGQKTVIKATFNTKGYYGPIEQYIYVHTDNPDISFLTYTLTAKVKARSNKTE